MKKHNVENSWYCTMVLLLHILTIAPLISYHLSSLNPMIPVVRNIYNQTFYDRTQEYMDDDSWNALLSVTMSILLVSAFIGSLLFKVLLKYLTRKQVMMVAHGVNILGTTVIAIGVGTAGSYEAFIFGRLLQGFMLGLGLSVCPVIVSETCVAHRSQIYGGMLGASFPLGSMIGPLMGWSKVLGSDQTYLGAILFGMFPSLVYFAFAYWITETPFQAYIKNGEQGAIRVLRKLRLGEESEFDVEMKSLRGEIKDEESNESAEEATLMEVLKTPQYRRHFLGCVILYSYIMLCGLNNILFYSDSIFLTSGVNAEAVTPASIGVFLLGFIFACIGVVALNYFEPRKLLLLGSAFIISGHALTTASTATFELVPAMSVVAIVSMCIYYIGFVTIDLSIFAVTGVIAIDKTRAVCTNYAAAACWFFAWVVGFTSSYLQLALGPYVFLIWMVLSIFCTVYTIVFIPNIGGKTQEEIQDFFKDK